jgi:hypothetical protein
MQPHWRPNFNNPSALPDIKVIRTDFIVNFIAVSLALIVGFYAVQREYRAYSLKQSIGKMEQRIRVAEPDDNLHLAQSERFRESSRHIVELQKFFVSPTPAHQLLAQLTELKPEGLIFNMVNFSEGIAKEGSKSFAEYRINFSGDVKDPLFLDEFKTSLQDSSLLDRSDYESEINESLQSRDAKTGIFPYRMSIKLRPAQAVDAAKEGGQG